jgi:transposase
MIELPKELPNDPELLKQLVLMLVSAMGDVEEKLKLLEQRYRNEMRAKYGRRAESLDPAQLRLFIQAALEQIETDQPSKPTSDAESSESTPQKNEKLEKRKKGHGRRKPQELPRRPVMHDIPDSEKACPRCTIPRVVCGRQVSLQIDYTPGIAFYWEHIRLKYACRACEGHVQTAPPPAYPIDRGMPAAGMLSYIATSKYADHLPLYRLEGILSRQGLVLSRSTMCDWMRSTSKILLTLFEHLILRIKQSKVIWTDDTPVRVLDRELKKRCRTGRIWVYRGDEKNPYILYRFTPSRKRDGPLEHLENFKGFMQADAFAGYDCIFVGGGVTEVACFAHARRKFERCLDQNPKDAGMILYLIQQLYKVESDFKGVTAEQRLEARQRLSKPLLTELKILLDAQLISTLPKSDYGMALKYALNQWDALNVFVNDGDLTIDNNLAENALRPIALGRKNWMFLGSEAGGETIAIISSLIASCRRLQVDPQSYLKTVIRHLTENPDTDPALLMPDVVALDAPN